MDSSIAFKPGEKSVLALIDGVIGLLETVFPERIRAYYLTGSYAEDTAVPHSDLDMIIIFKGEFVGDEANRLRQLRHHASKLSPIHLDLAPRCEADLFASGATGLKLASQLLYGEDIRDQIPLESIAQYRYDIIRSFLTYQREIRGEPDQIPDPIVAPDPCAEFFGYDTFGNWFGRDHGEKGTRLLLNLTTSGATASLAILHGERASSKRNAIEKYQQFIGDEWGDWLAELYQLAKVELGYEIPQDTAVRQKLRHLIQQTPAFENVILGRCQPHLPLVE